MLKLSYETDMPAGEQIYCYLSCNVRRNKGERKKEKRKRSILQNVFTSRYGGKQGVVY